ncbi:hypothetical protein EMCRGX_G003943 [Ephydatia muelleri]
MQFLYDAESVELDELANKLTALLQHIDQRPSVVGDGNYLYKLDPSKMADPLFNYYQFNSQYPSSGSIVMNVTENDTLQQYVLKITSNQACSILVDMKEILSDSDSVLHFISNKRYIFNMKMPVLTYSVCEHGPLLIHQASHCLFDFVDQLHQVLDTIHSKGVEHCDLHLENICFRLAHNQFRIVLIDLELAQLSNALHWKDVFDDRKTSCMYNKINDVASIDFLQLGYMILWVHYYDSLKRNHSALSHYDLYHSMHTYDDNEMPLKNSDRFIASLINNGVYGDISDSTLLAETCHSTPLQDVLGTFAATPGPSGPNAAEAYADPLNMEVSVDVQHPLPLAATEVTRGRGVRGRPRLTGRGVAQRHPFNQEANENPAPLLRVAAVGEPEGAGPPPAAESESRAIRRREVPDSPAGLPAKRQRRRPTT